MIAPIPWFLFEDSLHIQIERAGTLEEAVQAFRDSLPDSLRREALLFLQKASAVEGTRGWTVECPELDNALFIEPDDDSVTCASHYGEMLRAFLS